VHDASGGGDKQWSLKCLRGMYTETPPCSRTASRILNGRRSARRARSKTGGLLKWRPRSLPASPRSAGASRPGPVGHDCVGTSQSGRAASGSPTPRSDPKSRIRLYRGAKRLGESRRSECGTHARAREGGGRDASGEASGGDETPLSTRLDFVSGLALQQPVVAAPQEPATWAAGTAACGVQGLDEGR
jgi:hypothetical protein